MKAYEEYADAGEGNNWFIWVVLALIILYFILR